jgi:PAS domain S-box-containing protein
MDPSGLSIISERDDCRLVFFLFERILCFRFFDKVNGMSLANDKKPETDLTENANRTEVILQSLSEGVCQISPGGITVYANGSAERILGYSRKNAVGMRYSELFFSKNEGEYSTVLPYCPIHFVLASGETSHVSSEIFYRNDGSEVYVEYICVPLFEGNEIAGAVISFQDVAERIEGEKAVAAARDLAIAAAETRATFLANMSHEIRTPLNGIVGTSNLLMDSNLSGEQSEYVRMLKTSADMLRNIVDDILDFSKIDAGIRELLIGDHDKLRQILLNFLSNAIKFTSKGSIVLRITVESDGPSSKRLKFEVEDTGIGIRQDLRSGLFEPFTQADSSTTRQFGGTGLGLAICRQLVELMGGVIGYDSKFGEGSNFWFSAEFPKASKEIRKNVKNSQTKQESGVASFGDEPTLNQLRVLIVEDNPINSAVTAMMLKQLGMSSEIAENGLIAVERTAAEEFDLIFMDCQMPEMDGFETAKKIRRQDTSNHAKIIAVTASTSIRERDKSIAAGMDDFLAKPFTKKGLFSILKKHFKPDPVSLNLDLDDDMIEHSLANIIDSKKLENFLEIESNGKEHFTSKILNLFLTHSENLISEIDGAIDAGDFKTVAAKAHNLKGSSGNVGLSVLHTMFDELEDLAKKK